MIETESAFPRGESLQCDLLDEYLGSELSGDRRVRFESHLESCPSCRDAVDEWQALCRKLETATRQLETPSRDLCQRIELEVTGDRPPVAREAQWESVAGLLAASLVAAFLFVFMLRPAPRHEEIASTPAAPRRDKLALSRPKVEFSEDVIGVPVDIGDPNVTVVWLYPTAPVRNQTK
jgi:anti-sigma factor RsiW